MNKSWTTFDFRSGAPVVRQAVHWDRDVHLDGRPLMDQLARVLPTAAADLMELATAVYTADRLKARDVADAYKLGWSRRLRLHVPVRLPDLWESHADALVRLLSWLTDDEWSLHFHQTDPATAPLDNPQDYLFPTVPDHACVALFSGGLDSTAGLAVDLDTDPVTDVLTVRVVTNGRMESRQKAILRHFGSRVHDCRLPLSLASGLSAESSQRTRGFLFMAAGVATALTAGKNVLRVYENGIGAINLPLLESQRGSQATRAVHPRTVRMMERLATSLNGGGFRIELPHLWSTKAELLLKAPASFSEAYANSVSCDRGFATRTEGARPCGRCTSCILRRQSVFASGLLQIDSGQQYRHRLDAAPLPWELRASLWQIHRIRVALDDSDPWSAFLHEFPQVLDVPATERESGRAAVLRLYGQYCAEWQAMARQLGVNMSNWGLEGAAAA
ncbi:7-cyano-7-deazaguanine synthase [Nonomuraea sp. NPDC051941]|uniref:7-cyano-7-deazaguanine synthase n=1 Tax=Nonomuraea sp. NPDC051941 TaxID=3364373 RepID=UPI0037CAECCE